MQLASRKRKGSSITELCISILILGVSMGVVGELAVLVTQGTVKTTNKTNSLSSGRLALDRICSDIRRSRAIGDYYGTGSNRLSFPATALGTGSGNPIYGSSAPNGGWPGAPWTVPMMLSDSTLIIQTPVTFDSTVAAPTAFSKTYDGFPLIIKKGTLGAGLPAANVENLDTTVYMVVPNTKRLGEFQIQVARFPGAPVTGLSRHSPINPPETILNGLVGPTNVSSTVPSVFSYYKRSSSSTVPVKITAPTANDIDDIVGIGIDIEVKNTGLKVDQGDGRFPEYFGIHTEAFMRSARDATMNNTQ